METILLAITAVSLLVAFVMSAAAWRMARDERARAQARIAALASASSLDEPAPAGAAAPAALAAAPAASIAPADELPLRIVEPAPAPRLHHPSPAPAPAPSALHLAVAPDPGPASVPAGFLSGVEAPAESAGRQRGLMAAAAVLFVVLGSGAYLLISGAAAPEEGTASAAPAAVSAPLELISLRHERLGSKLSLSGLVKNPATGAPVEALSAVVFLFDAQGGFISSARAGVDFKRLAAGDESPFVVSMEAPASVARYRVSFRTDAGVVAHVDRRGEQPVAAALVR